MNLHTLKPAKGATHSSKRIARGEGSGHGGTSTAGNKGAQSRAGYNSKRGHEGGQTPIQRRLPKRGFKNINRVEFQTINLSDIVHYATKFNVTTIDTQFLITNKIIGKTEKVKVLSNGELSQKINVSAHAYSAKAKAAIEEKGGTAELIK